MPLLRPNDRRVAVALVLLLSGCTAFDRGAEQGAPTVLAASGCPDLSGRYVLGAYDEDGMADAARVSVAPADVTDQLFTPAGESGPGDLSSYEGVIIGSDGDHGIAFTFVRPYGRVGQELERIREDERPRYAEWYRLVQPDGRARFVAAHGEPAYRQRLAALGPSPGRTVVLRQFTDFTCEHGWIVRPRPSLSPVRMTLDPRGHLVFESKEYSGFEVPVWCGDGCKSLKIPTGAYLGVTTWARSTSLSLWDPEVVGQNLVFPRPVEVIEAEQAVLEENARRSAERRFARPEDVRAALVPLLPEGVAIQSVELSTLPFLGDRIRVVAVAADPAMPYEEQRKRQLWFLQALRDGDPGYIEDKEVVQRAISGGGAMRHEMEIYLDTHPLVQPGGAPPSSAVTSPAVAFVAPPTVALPAVTAPPAEAAPPGFATLPVIESRLKPLFAEGCRLEQARYGGDAVVVSGEADTLQAVSNTLRALDGQGRDGGRGVELLKAEALPDGGGYRFEIRVPASPLTKA